MAKLRRVNWSILLFGKMTGPIVDIARIELKKSYKKFLLIG
jgi:hypothetical protein